MAAHALDILEAFHSFINDDAYPCVAARAALSRNNISCMIADHIDCPKEDHHILQFMYQFIGEFRTSGKSLHSAAVIFREPERVTEESFETSLWERLQSLSSMDARNYSYDARVDSHPMAPGFSYSLGEEAFFVIGLHPGSSRPSRRFKYPAIVFNPHAQFEELRKANRYEKMKSIVRKRDMLYSNSINPMLADFGEISEAFQYSGKNYSREWKCPLNITHAATKDHSTEE